MVLDSQGPVLISEPRSSVEFSNKTGAMIHCSAQGSPLPRIDWLMGDGSPVIPIPHIRETLVNGSMYFLPFRAESYRHDVHSAIYRCQASNSVGRVLSREITVKAGEYLYFTSSDRSLLHHSSGNRGSSTRHHPISTLRRYYPRKIHGHLIVARVQLTPDKKVAGPLFFHGISRRNTRSPPDRACLPRLGAITRP